MRAATAADGDAPSSARGRVSWIDAAKGLGIILIVLGHIASVESPSLLYVYIYAFHVPLFFFISGLTLKPERDPFGTMLKGKLRSLLLPYLCYALLGYGFYIAGYGLAQALHLKIEQFNYGPWHPLLGVFIGTLGDGVAAHLAVVDEGGEGGFGAVAVEADVAVGVAVASGLGLDLDVAVALAEIIEIPIFSVGPR